MYEALEICGLEWPRSGFLNCTSRFHQDDTPSLKLYQDSFYCFGCQRSGDAFGFIAQTKHMKIGKVLKEWGEGEGRRLSSAVADETSRSKQNRLLRSSFSALSDSLAKKVHSTFGGYDTDILIREIVRLSEALDDLYDKIYGRGEYEDSLSAFGADEEMDGFRGMWMDALDDGGGLDDMEVLWSLDQGGNNDQA